MRPLPLVLATLRLFGKQRTQPLTRRQFLKVSMSTSAGLLIANQAAAQPAGPASSETSPIARATLRPELDPIYFPDILVFRLGDSVLRDPTRVLLFFKKPLTRKQVEGLLIPAGLVLEDFNDPVGRKLGLQGGRVNHSERRWWVRSRSGEAIQQKLLLSLQKPLTEKLERIGPGYKLPHATGWAGLFCPLPHVLVVKPSPRADAMALNGALSPFALQEVPDISKHLAGYRYFVLTDGPDPNVYAIYRRLLRFLPDPIQNVLFDVMPLLSPLAASHLPNDPYYVGDPRQWNMDKIHAGGLAGSSGWEDSGHNPGAGVVVAVIDNGIDLFHPDLALADGGVTLDFPPLDTGLPQEPCPVPANCPAPQGNGSYRFSDEDHGTQVAGIVGAVFNNARGLAGLAGKCTILSLRSANRLISERATAIPYAVEKGAQVINMSFSENPNDYNVEPYKSWKEDIINPNIKEAFNKGVLLCAATGNSGSSVIGYPASFDEYVIACGSSDPDDRRCQASTCNSTSSQYGDGLSVIAPGGNLVSTTVRGQGSLDSDYKHPLAGTSFATPHVAGLAAMLLHLYPGLTGDPRRVRSIIERTADKVPTDTDTYQYRTDSYPAGSPLDGTLRYPSGPWHEQVGYGRINVHHALKFSDVFIKDYAADTGAEPSAAPDGNFWTFSEIAIRPTDDGVFQPADPLQSSQVVHGQDNYLYVQVTNTGPATAENVIVDARIVAHPGTEFVYSDWITEDASHLKPDALEVGPWSVPAGTQKIAKFTIPAALVDTVWTQNWHPCLLASVVCDHDYAFLKHKEFANLGPEVVRLNNLAQKNLTVIQIQPGAHVDFPILVGTKDRARTELAVEILIERGLIGPIELPPLRRPFPLPPLGISFDVAADRFPRVKNLAPVREVRSDAGEIVRRDNIRRLEISREKAVIRMGASATGVSPMALETVIPENASEGQVFATTITQRNQYGQVCGGVTVMYVVKRPR